MSAIRGALFCPFLCPTVLNMTADISFPILFIILPSMTRSQATQGDSVQHRVLPLGCHSYVFSIPLIQMLIPQYINHMDYFQGIFRGVNYCFKPLHFIPVKYVMTTNEPFSLLCFTLFVLSYLRSSFSFGPQT